MPNGVVEKVLLVVRKYYPAYGPARLANELGNIVCFATVYNILRRHNLSRKLEDRRPARIFSPNICYQLIHFTYAHLKVLEGYTSFVQLIQTQALKQYICTTIKAQHQL